MAQAQLRDVALTLAKLGAAYRDQQVDAVADPDSSAARESLARGDGGEGSGAIESMQEVDLTHESVETAPALEKMRAALAEACREKTALAAAVEERERENGALVRAAQERGEASR